MWSSVVVVCADEIFMCGNEHLQLKFFPRILSFTILAFNLRSLGRNILMYEVLYWHLFCVCKLFIETL